MKNKFTLGILFFGLLLVSCKREESQNIAQDRIYSDYSVTYDAGKNQTTATATFRTDHSDGKKIELSYPARVKFRNENMSWKSVSGSYQLVLSGNGLQHYFTYSDLDENNFENQALDLNAIDLPFGLNSISKNGNFFLPWIGDVLRSGETIKVTINSKEGTGNKSWTVTAVNSNHIILDQYKLNQLPEGNAEIWIERSKSESLQMVPDAGGRITSSWKSTTKMIQIVN